MSIFNRVIKNEQLLFNIFILTIVFCGILFGIVFYYFGDDQLVDVCQYLFFYPNNQTTNNYNYYLIITSVYILLSLIIATSFLGVIINGFIIFTKGMQLVNATMLYFALNEFNVSSLFLGYLPQFLLELILFYVISIMACKMALNCFLTNFITTEVFNSHKVINYFLNYLIIILILVSLSMAFKVYCI